MLYIILILLCRLSGNVENHRPKVKTANSTKNHQIRLNNPVIRSVSKLKQAVKLVLQVFSYKFSENGKHLLKSQIMYMY